MFQKLKVEKLCQGQLRDILCFMASDGETASFFFFLQMVLVPLSWDFLCFFKQDTGLTVRTKADDLSCTVTQTYTMMVLGEGLREKSSCWRPSTCLSNSVLVR